MQQNHFNKLTLNLINEIKKCFTSFIQECRDDQGNNKYLRLAEIAINNSKHLIIFSFRDFLHFNPIIADIVFSEYYKYEPVLN
jgi:hypothetical protein